MRYLARRCFSSTQTAANFIVHYHACSYAVRTAAAVTPLDGHLSLRQSLGSIKRRLWHSERAIVYASPDDASVRGESNLRFVGLNGFRRPSDATDRPELSRPYSDFQKAGDAGLLAFHEDRLVGWLWLRSGPYMEAVGCGAASIEPGQVVMRHVEINPTDQRRGFGRQLLSEAAIRLLREPRVKTIAFVASANVASRKAFDAAGYKPIGTVTFRRILGRPKTIHVAHEEIGAQ